MISSSKNFAVLLTILVLAGIAIGIYRYFSMPSQESLDKTGSKPSQENLTKHFAGGAFPEHKNVVVSVFWVGEHADNANDFISNKASVWDEKWQDHFGGVDDPDNRSGFLPADFTPRENPFYFALPYNDLDDQGNRKPQAFDTVYWATDRDWRSNESMCKNQWVKISKDGLNVFAQWEDAGPFGDDDSSYVFGPDDPSNTKKSEAGLDVSPAVRDYLDLSGIDRVTWQFVREGDVPDGPWKQIVTTRNGN